MTPNGAGGRVWAAPWLFAARVVSDSNFCAPSSKFCCSPPRRVTPCRRSPRRPHKRPTHPSDRIRGPVRHVCWSPRQATEEQGIERCRRTTDAVMASSRVGLLGTRSLSGTYTTSATARRIAGAPISGWRVQSPCIASSARWYAAPKVKPKDWSPPSPRIQAAQANANSMAQLSATDVAFILPGPSLSQPVPLHSRWKLTVRTLKARSSPLPYPNTPASPESSSSSPTKSSPRGCAQRPRA